MRTLLRRHQREFAHYECELAAFAPGLSPEQRRLLFAGAIVRLDLPLPDPELQPVDLPATGAR